MFFQKFIIFTIILLKTGANSKENVQAPETISIVFILENSQKNLVNELMTVFKEIEQRDHVVTPKIKDNFIFLNRNDVNETEAAFCSILYKGITITIDMTYGLLTNTTLVEFIKGLRVPYIHVDFSISTYMRIAENYINARSGTDTIFIFENEQAYEEALYYTVHECDLRVVLLNGLSDDFIDRLKNIKPLPEYYVIIATTPNMNLIYEKILTSKFKLLNDRWHLFFLDFQSNQFKYKNSLPLLTTFAPILQDICRRMMLNECGNNMDSFSLPKIQLTEIINFVVKNIDSMGIPPTIGNCENPDQSSPSTEQSQFLPTTAIDNSIINLENDRITLSLNFTIIGNFGNFEEKPIAFWKQRKLVEVEKNSTNPAKRFFRIGTTEAIPWSYYRRDPVTNELILDENGQPIWEGYCIDLIQKLSERMQFDYEIVPPKTGTFGKSLPNGTWDGIVGDLVRGDTEIAVAALKMISEREEVIDFVPPYFEQTGISIVIRKPIKQTSLFKFMTVLRLEVWLSIIGALITTAIMIWLLEVYSPYSYRNYKEAYPYPCREFTLKESIWFALTSFTPQGGGETPQAISGRVLVAAYWLFVVLMLATFTANLAAFLTVERMQTPVQSLEQLARQSRINYTVVRNSDTHKYFINMKFAEDTLYRLWSELVLNATADQSQYRIWDYPIKEQYGHILIAINDSEPVKDAAEGFRKVSEHENADFAFIHDSAEIKYEISKNCNLTEVGEVFGEQPYAIAIQQGSHLQDELSINILELQKDRFFEELTAKFWNNSAIKECTHSDENEGITLESLGGVFIATLFGLALSLITLIGEIIYYKKKNNEIHPTSKEKIKKGDKLKQHIPIYKNKKMITVHGTPPPPFDETTFDTRNDNYEVNFNSNVTLGSRFIPVRQRNRVSYRDFSNKALYTDAEPSMQYVE